MRKTGPLYKQTEANSSPSGVFQNSRVPKAILLRMKSQQYPNGLVPTMITSVRNIRHWNTQLLYHCSVWRLQVDFFLNVYLDQLALVSWSVRCRKILRPSAGSAGNKCCDWLTMPAMDMGWGGTRSHLPICSPWRDFLEDSGIGWWHSSDFPCFMQWYSNDILCTLLL